MLKESIYLGNAPVTETDPYGGEDTIITTGDTPNFGGVWEKFGPGSNGITANGRITVLNDSCNKTLWINTDSLTIRDSRGGQYSLTDKIFADIRVTPDCEILCNKVSSLLTVRDLSIPTTQFLDTRSARDDVIVYQHHNYGILIDGTGNPVEKAFIQLNGHDRFTPKDGSYFNYLQPDRHHTNTPADGINVYSFAIKPEEHQPSGTVNLSRIDNTSLNIWLKDCTCVYGLPGLNFYNPCNKLYVFANSYNVLRILSGMAGLAYSS